MLIQGKYFKGEKSQEISNQKKNTPFSKGNDQNEEKRKLINNTRNQNNCIIQIENKNKKEREDYSVNTIMLHCLEANCINIVSAQKRIDNYRKFNTFRNQEFYSQSERKDKFASFNKNNKINPTTELFKEKISIDEYNLEEPGEETYEPNKGVANNPRKSKGVPLLFTNYCSSKIKKPPKHSNHNINSRYTDGIGQRIRELFSKNNKEQENKNLVNSANTFRKLFTEKTEQKKNKIEILSIPCMNCGNLIKMDEIEKHSLNCLKVSEDIRKIDSSKHQINLIDYKLRKLKEYINNIEKEIINNDNNLSTNLKYIITVIKDYIEKTLNYHGINISTIKELKKIHKNFETLEQGNNKSLNCMIIIDRAKILINEKIKIFRETYKNEMKSQKNVTKKLEDLELRRQICYKKKELEKLNLATQFEIIKVKNLRNSATPKNRQFALEAIREINDSPDVGNTSNNNISNNIKTSHLVEILSDVENEQNQKEISDETSQSAFNSSDEKDSIFFNSRKKEEIIKDNLIPNNEYLEKEKELDLVEKINLKKKFFLQVLKIRIEKLHSSHMGQKIPIKMIWEESRKNNIEEKNWNDFILKELNTPYKYLDNILEKKTKKNHSLMDIIKEES